MIPINRSALIIYPGQPIYDWANRIFNENEDYGPVDLAEHDAATVYLIEELDSPEDFEEWMQANYEYFFQAVLEEWTPDESLWPEQVDYGMFREWFHVVYHSMVLDVEEVPLKRDED